MKWGDVLKVIARYAVWAGLIVLTLGFIYSVGHKQGLADARLECAKGETQQASDTLNQLVAGTRELTAQANAASRQLAQQIADRATADDQSTKEIRDALKKTAATRVNCMFDAGIMRHLAEAQQRSAAAAAHGFTPRAGGGVPTAAPAGG